MAARSSAATASLDDGADCLARSIARKCLRIEEREQEACGVRRIIGWTSRNEIHIC